MDIDELVELLHDLRGAVCVAGDHSHNARHAFPLTGPHGQGLNVVAPPGKHTCTDRHANCIAMAIFGGYLAVALGLRLGSNMCAHAAKFHLFIFGPVSLVEKRESC